MPAHIYLRLGRYNDAITSSIQAINADNILISKCLTPYVPNHNIAMLVSAALFSGRYSIAMKYSPYHAIGMPHDAALYLSALYPSPKDIVMTKFGLWKDIIELDNIENKNKNNQNQNDKTELSLNNFKKSIFDDYRNSNENNENENVNDPNELNLDSKENFQLLRNRHIKRVLTDAPPYVQALHMYTKTLAFIGTGDIEKGQLGLNRLIDLVAQVCMHIYEYIFIDKEIYVCLYMFS